MARDDDFDGDDFVNDDDSVDDDSVDDDVEPLGDVVDGDADDDLDVVPDDVDTVEEDDVAAADEDEDDEESDDEDEDEDEGDEDEVAEDEEEESLDVLLARETGADDQVLGRLDDETRDTLSVPTLPIGEGEFTCRSCFLVKRRAQLADEEKLICLDCA